MLKKVYTLVPDWLVYWTDQDEMLLIFHASQKAFFTVETSLQ